MKRNVSVGLLVVLLVLGLVACGGTQAPVPTAEKPQPTEAPTAAQPAESVSLRLWTHQNNTFNAGYEALIQAFKASHPGVEITLETFDYDTYIQTLQTAMPAGEEADILQLFGTWTAEYAERLAPDAGRMS